MAPLILIFSSIRQLRTSAASRPRQNPSSHYTGVCVSHRPTLDVSENRKSISPTGIRTLIPRLSVNRLRLFISSFQCYKAYFRTHPLVAQNPPPQTVIY